MKTGEITPHPPTCGPTDVSTIDHFPLVQGKRGIIPYSMAKEKKVLPVQEEMEYLLVAMADPLDLEAVEELRFFCKKRIIPLPISPAQIERAIERCYGQKAEETTQLFSSLAEGEPRGAQEGYDLLEPSHENLVIKGVNALLLEAIQQGASDIHFEPREEGLSVRYRIDGVLQRRPLRLHEHQRYIARIKVMAQLDIAEERLPQDGRMKLRQGGKEIDFRVSTLPTVYGERLVLRILDKGNIALGLDHIGMEKEFANTLRKVIHAPEGMLLVTGPTGSGKTTTLYSALTEINSLEQNIMTIEDPVEYKISHISQMNVNQKIDLNFSRGLRHILRQDPDVIMIGEIRDAETATIAIQASLTGHRVLTTLHTNDAPSALTRLTDMGIAPYLLASSILGIVAQRLVRIICPACKEYYPPTPEELSELHLDPSHFIPLARGKGCNLCFHTGYQGRRALYEMVVMNHRMKQLVLQTQDSEELRRVALTEGLVPLFRQGVALVVQGDTTSTELLRVSRLPGEEEIPLPQPIAK